MGSQPTNHKSRARGFTLIEMMVGASLACMILFFLVLFFVFGIHSFAAMSNYSDLNKQSRYASDLLSRDIRLAPSVNGTSTSNTLVLNGSSGPTYAYSPTSRTLTRTVSGVSQTLLKEVDSLRFTLYQRPLSNATYGVFPVATNASVAKLVAFQWTCSRKVANYATNTECLQTALVEMRNE